MPIAMRCYAVLLVGNLTYHVESTDSVERPLGYAVSRFVLAANEREAAIRAVRWEQEKFARDWPEVHDRFVTVAYEVEEVGPAPFVRLLSRPIGRAYFNEH